MNKEIKGTYQGYIWMSDSSVPEVYDNKSVERGLKDGENPFVIEGQLYDSENKHSISIKYVDGEYLIKEYTINENDIMVDEEYIPNRMDGIKGLRFKRVWRPEKDEQCEGMEVLQPAELIFVGFKK